MVPEKPLPFDSNERASSTVIIYAEDVCALSPQHSIKAGIGPLSTPSKEFVQGLRPSPKSQCILSPGKSTRNGDTRRIHPQRLIILNRDEFSAGPYRRIDFISTEYQARLRRARGYLRRWNVDFTSQSLDFETTPPISLKSAPAGHRIRKPRHLDLVLAAAKLLPITWFPQPFEAHEARRATETWSS